MSVYIEYVILDNFIMDFIILYAVSKTLRLRCGRIRLCFSSAAGTVLAVLLPLISAPQIILLLIKLACGIIMSSLISPFKIKKILLAYIFFITYTFVLGGAAIGILYVLDADIYSAASLAYSYKAPLGLLAGACFAYVILLIKLVRYLYRRKNILPFVRKIVIIHNGKEIPSTGYIDSGNKLYDDSGQPVMIISPLLLEQIFPPDIVLSLYAGSAKNGFKKKEFITAQYRKSYIYLFKIDKLLIYSGDKANTIVNVSAGANLSEFKGIEGCRALLHCDMILNENEK
jgi:stage II sporulation protein GA (sporulation sigma-E factor processing peptidase)